MIDDYGTKGVVVGIDTYEGDVVLSLLMRNHKVPQLVKASGYKTKTGRHFSLIQRNNPSTNYRSNRAKALAKALTGAENASNIRSA